MQALNPEEVERRMEATLTRMVAAGFQIIPLEDMEAFYLVTRDNLVCFVQRQESGAFGSSGNPGKVSENGMNTFLWKGEGQGAFVAKGWREEATAEECEAVARFSRELRLALQPTASLT